jgi:uncharacterized protein (DUF1778 family)
MTNTTIIPIRLPDDWKEAFTAAASEQGMTMTDWLLEAGREKLERTKGHKRTASKLSPRKQRGRPKQT